MSLTDNEIRVLSLVEQRFWETGLVPTNEKIAEDLKTTIVAVRKAWEKPEFRQALTSRGVDLTPDDSASILNPTQVVLANILLNIHDKRSTREKLDTCGVSSQQFHAWMRQDAFAKYMRKRAEKAFDSHAYAAYNTVMAAVEGGDVNAAMKFFEMQGIYNPRIQVDVNIESVIVNLIEIVARHVKDPVALEAIATEIETIDMSTGRPRALPAVALNVFSSEPSGMVGL